MTTTDPTELVCEPWCTDADLPCVQYDDDPVVVEDWIRFASEVLYLLSDSIYPGPCLTVVRPCARRRPGREPRWYGGQRRGGWGECSCNRSDRCGCWGLQEIDLGPDVQAITEVKLDGVVVDPAEYDVSGGRYLVAYQRADGTQLLWPCCQRLDLRSTEVDTFEVTFIRGLMPPIGGVKACAVLACELLKASRGDAECRLPKRVTSVTRQGVTVAVLDPLTMFGEGRTGLQEVDMWLASVALGASRREATVIVPGEHQRYIVTQAPQAVPRDATIYATAHDLSVETSARIAGDDAEASARSAADAAEVAIRAAADSAEIAARAAADAAEVSARIADVSDEETARIGAVAAEASARSAADTSEQAARLAADVSLASADVTLQAAIDAEATARASAVDAEAAARAAADTTEATARAAADTAETLARQADDATEASVRAAADTAEAAARSTAVANETALRAAADTAEVAARAAAVAVEAAARAAADVALQPGAWQVLSLPAGTTPRTGFQVPAYRLEGDRVRFRGQMTVAVGGYVASSTIDTLPAPFRPSAQVQMTSRATSGQTAIQVNASGTVSCITAQAGSGFISFDGCTFVLA